MEMILTNESNKPNEPYAPEMILTKGKFPLGSNAYQNFEPSNSLDKGREKRPKITTGTCMD